MKQNLLISFILFLSHWILDSALAANSDIDPTTTAAKYSRIYRIENGLLPGILIKGHSVHEMRLIDRMEHYHVPGVSIAFFAQGKILWTRAYGYADVSRKAAVTLE